MKWFAELYSYLSVKLQDQIEVVTDRNVKIPCVYLEKHDEKKSYDKLSVLFGITIVNDRIGAKFGYDIENAVKKLLSAPINLPFGLMSAIEIKRNNAKHDGKEITLIYRGFIKIT